MRVAQPTGAGRGIHSLPFPREKERREGKGADGLSCIFQSFPFRRREEVLLPQELLSAPVKSQSRSRLSPSSPLPFLLPPLTCVFSRLPPHFLFFHEEDTSSSSSSSRDEDPARRGCCTTRAGRGGGGGRREKVEGCGMCFRRGANTGSVDFVSRSCNSRRAKSPT